MSDTPTIEAWKLPNFCWDSDGTLEFSYDRYGELDQAVVGVLDAINIGSEVIVTDLPFGAESSRYRVRTMSKSSGRGPYPYAPPPVMTYKLFEGTGTTSVLILLCASLKAARGLSRYLCLFSTTVPLRFEPLAPGEGATRNGGDL